MWRSFKIIVLILILIFLPLNAFTASEWVALCAPTQIVTGLKSSGVLDSKNFKELTAVEGASFRCSSGAGQPYAFFVYRVSGGSVACKYCISSQVAIPSVYVCSDKNPLSREICFDSAAERETNALVNLRRRMASGGDIPSSPVAAPAPPPAPRPIVAPSPAPPPAPRPIVAPSPAPLPAPGPIIAPSPAPLPAPRPSVVPVSSAEAEFHAAVQYIFTVQRGVLNERLYQDKMAEFEATLTSLRRNTRLTEAQKVELGHLNKYHLYAIYVYTTLADAYKTINTALRTSNTTEIAKLRPITNHIIEYLKYGRSLSAFGAVRTLKLSRFVYEASDSPRRANYTTLNSTVVDAGFVSMTSAPNLQAGTEIHSRANFHLVVRLLTGGKSKGTALFKGVTDFAEESEVLFPPGTKFQVKMHYPPGSKTSPCYVITHDSSKACVELDEKE